MALASGSKLGQYQIVGPLGAGGMGEVYRARDPKLGRDVAIKVLPPSLSADGDRLQRFEREARAAAALNHPNLLAVFQMGTHEGVPYLVAELLEGETLREHLRPGALPVAEALDYGGQIARGLAAAHDKGIVHRDLKPENLFVVREGRVKILDFGLARLTRHDEAGSFETRTRESETAPGVVMGTVGYMSPEQVKGLPADHRSDLFSLGAILCEMLSGQRTFHKATSAETLTAILNEAPPDLSQITPTIPVGLQRVAHRCLQKAPEQRFQSASDLAFALEALSGSDSASLARALPPARTARARWRHLAAGLGGLGVALAILFGRASQPPSSRLQASILPPPGQGFWANVTQPAALSPDGLFLAMVAMRGGHRQLWVRRLNGSEAQPIAGTEGVTNPFWSPDSRYVGFFAGEKLKKLHVAGGSITDICPAGAHSMGGAWSSRGVIVFATFADTLKRVPEDGGVPEPISGLPLSHDALGQHWPVFLPDGNHLLYLEWSYANPTRAVNGVFLASLDGTPARRLPLASTNVEFSQGSLLFSQGGDLFAQRFDLGTLALVGTARPVARNIQYDTFFCNAAFTVSQNGILVYGAAGTGVNSQLTWVDRGGNPLGVLGEPGLFFAPAISPDATQVAVGVKPSDVGENIWIYDVRRGTRVPLDPNPSGRAPYSPCWSPDGKDVLYRKTEGKTSSLHVRAADGSGRERQIGERVEGVFVATDWSADGRYWAVTRSRFVGAQNWHDTLLVIRATKEPKTDLEIEDARSGSFSPDGRWLAYADKTSGQVYVTRVPGPAGPIAVSSSGGRGPSWRGDGQELYYVDGDRTLISVQVRESAQEFRVLSSRPLFRLTLPWNVGFYDVTRDGKRFLVNTRTYREEAMPLTLVTQWSSESTTR